MFSKINVFITLTKNLYRILDNSEKVKLNIYTILSVFNTFLEIVSVATIVFLLFIITGEAPSSSKISEYVLYFINKQDPLLSSAILMISIILIKTLFQLVYYYNQEKLGYNIQKRLTNVLYYKFINSDYEDYLSRNSSKILRILTIDSFKISNGIISPIITIINEILLLSFITVFIFSYDILLGISVYFISILMLLIFSLRINKIMKKLGVIINSFNTARIKSINESFRSFDIIKLHKKTLNFENKYKFQTDKITDAGFKSIFYMKIPKSIYEFVIFTLLFFLILIFKITGKVDALVPILSVLAISVYKIIPSLNKLSNSLQAIQLFSKPFADIIEFLKIKQDQELNDDIIDFKTLSYSDISFNYFDKKDILSRINLEINKGDFIGIFGESGSGKSTLIKLLSGLLIPKNGKILMNSMEIKSDNLKNYFSYVPQDSTILDNNISVNISLNFDTDRINKERIIEVLKQVELYSIFKDKMDMNLGENGSKVSGGQKQRICIARALYHEKKILILDESTSNLDNSTEKKILSLLNRLNEFLTIIFISHRENSFKYANKKYLIRENNIEQV
jgi:ATP-binding cassette, subfamily B, bacterial PglK